MEKETMEKKTTEKDATGNDPTLFHGIPVEYLKLFANLINRSRGEVLLGMDYIEQVPSRATLYFSLQLHMAFVFFRKVDEYVFLRHILRLGFQYTNVASFIKDRPARLFDYFVLYEHPNKRMCNDKFSYEYISMLRNYLNDCCKNRAISMGRDHFGKCACRVCIKVCNKVCISQNTNLRTNDNTGCLCHELDRRFMASHPSTPLFRRTGYNLVIPREGRGCFINRRFVIGKASKLRHHKKSAFRRVKK